MATDPALLAIIEQAGEALNRLERTLAAGTQMAMGGAGIDFGTAAPTDGTWPQGWVRWNLAVTSGGVDYWRCTVAGTPGTWEPKTL